MTKNYERALVILNPYSGRGHGEKARDELARLLRETSTRYDIVETEHPGHGIDLALAGRLAGYELVVAAGGDGTVSEVMNGLMLANQQLIERARADALAEATEKAAAKAAEAAARAAAKAARAAAKAAKAAARAARAEKAAKNAEESPAGEASGESPAAELSEPAEPEPDQPETDEVDLDEPEDEPEGAEPDAAELEFTFEIPLDLQVAGTLGVVPVGSGNDFAAMVGIPLEMADAVKMLERRRLRLVDVGSADIMCPPGPTGEMRTVHRYFDNNMGIGLEASVTLESYKIRRLRGTLLYLTAAIRALLKKRSPHMHIKWRTQEGLEGSHDRPTLLVSVGNSRRTGGGFFLTPDAELDDKQLDVAIADDLSRPKVMALLPKALRGKHTTHPAVTMLRIERLTIQVPEGAPLQMDGEVVEVDAREVQITVLPHMLEVIA